MLKKCASRFASVSQQTPKNKPHTSNQMSDVHLCYPTVFPNGGFLSHGGTPSHPLWIGILHHFGVPHDVAPRQNRGSTSRGSGTYTGRSVWLGKPSAPAKLRWHGDTANCETVTTFCEWRSLEQMNWLVVWTPLKNISQLGWWNSNINGKIKFMATKPPTSEKNGRIHLGDDYTGWRRLVVTQGYPVDHWIILVGWSPWRPSTRLTSLFDPQHRHCCHSSKCSSNSQLTAGSKYRGVK